MNKTPRDSAVRVLYKIEFEKGFSNISLSAEIVSAWLSDLDKGFLIELVYGVIEKKVTLDYFISRFSKVPVRKLHDYVLIILRISVYQMVYMDKVPSYSICNEAVLLAKKYRSQNAGYVNATLRAMSSGKLEVPAFSNKLFHSKNRFLSVKYSLPEWLIERWNVEFGSEKAEAIFESTALKPRFAIRVNITKIGATELLESLKLKGFKGVFSGIFENSLIIENPAGIINSDEFAKGYFYVQDEAASLVSKVLSPVEFEKILDTCSAPGGKATHIAELIGNKAVIIACDIYTHKIKLIQENIERLGHTSVKPKLEDTSVFNPEFNEVFDRVLLDVPCSGTGLLSRKPEIRWQRKEQDFAELNKIQTELLNNCSKYLKVGGTMVYSTCSIDKAENEAIIESFLESHKNFELIGFDALLPDVLKNRGAIEGKLTLYPYLDGCDGFFISKLRRKS